MDQYDFYSEDDDDTPLDRLAFRRKKKFKRLRRARGRGEDDMPLNQLFPAKKKKKTRRRVYVDNALNRRLGRVGKPYGGHKMMRLADGRAKTMRLADGTKVRLFKGDYKVIKPKKKAHKGGKKLTAYQAFVKANYHTSAVMNAGGPRDRMRKLGAMWRARRGVKDTYRGKTADDAIAPLRGRKRLRRAR